MDHESREVLAVWLLVAIAVASTAFCAVLLLCMRRRLLKMQQEVAAEANEFTVPLEPSNDNSEQITTNQEELRGDDVSVSQEDAHVDSVGQKRADTAFSEH